MSKLQTRLYRPTSKAIPVKTGTWVQVLDLDGRTFLLCITQCTQQELQGKDKVGNKHSLLLDHIVEIITDKPA